MKFQSHLLLEEADVPASEEWHAPAPDWHFIRVDQGQGYWLMPGEAKEINPGDIVVLPPGCAGVCRASQLGVMRLLYFRFCPSIMSGLLTVMERHCFEKIAQRAPAPRLFSAGHPVAAIFATLGQEAEKHHGLLLRTLMLQLVANVFARELDRASEPERSTLSASKRIKVLMQHLTEEDFLHSSIADLAAYCGCSLRHFSRLFRQNFGVSLRDRQTELRLLKARQMLSETDSRVMTVAIACGYRHLGVFNAVFKRRFGVTPTEWRKDSAENPPANGHATPSSPSPGRKASGHGTGVVTEK